MGFERREASLRRGNERGNEPGREAEVGKRPLVEPAPAGAPRAVDNHLVGMVEVLAGGEDWRRGGR